MHRHDVYDTDRHFIIDTVTRRITNVSGKKSVVQYDHNSERFTFVLSRFVEEHDMTTCSAVEVHYINTGSSGTSEGVYPATDLQVSTDNDAVVVFSWLLASSATKYAGKLSFAIRFICASDGKIGYIWNTTIFNDITVLEGMDNT